MMKKFKKLRIIFFLRFDTKSKRLNQNKRIKVQY